RLARSTLFPYTTLFRSDNWLLLGDFGIARLLSSKENLTRTGTGTGTPEYIAPEQAQGRAEAASDIYSLAVLAYYLFTGRVPFKADRKSTRLNSSHDQIS